MSIVSIQGRLKIWTEHSTPISLSLKLLEIDIITKISAFLQLIKNGFSQNSEGVAQNLMFQTFLAGYPSSGHLEPSYFVQSGFL